MIKQVLCASLFCVLKIVIVFFFLPLTAIALISLIAIMILWEIYASCYHQIYKEKLSEPALCDIVLDNLTTGWDWIEGKSND